MKKSNDNFEIDLFQIFKAFQKKAMTIILATVICGGVAFGYATLLVTPLYKAEAMMYVNNSSISGGNSYSSISNAELVAAQNLVDTYIIILNSRKTLNKVNNEAGLDYDYEDLKSMISADAVNHTELFSIAVTSEEPEEAALIANTILKVLPNEISEVVDGSSVRIVDQAVVPTEKSFPNEKVFTIIGALLGFFISCFIILIMFVKDTKIHDEDYLMKTFDLPVLAVIPDFYINEKTHYYSTYDTRN